MKVRKTQILVSTSAFLLAIAVIFGWKVFEVWSQITYIWSGRDTPAFLFAQGSPHALRYTLVYPILVFSESYDLSHDYVFSWAVVVCLGLTNANIVKAAEIVSGRRLDVGVTLLAIAIPTNVIFFMINGRGAFALSGYSICLTVFLHFIYGGRFSIFHFVLLFLGFIMCSVSTGVLASVYVSAVVGVGIITYRMVAVRSTWRGLLHLCAMTVLLVAFSDFFVIGLRKNLEYFGNDLEGFKDLLSHGMGRFLVTFVEAPFMSLLLLFAVGVLGLAYIRRLRHATLLAFILTSLACGVFGYSTLAVASVPILAYMSLYASRLRFRTRTDTIRGQGAYLYSTSDSGTS